MRKLIFFSAFLSSLLLSINSYPQTEPQWEEVYILRGRAGSVREIRNIFADPRKASCVYICTDSGLLKSDDDGESWKPFGPTDEKNCRDILFNSLTADTIYVLGEGVVWRTLNEGADWEKVYGAAENPVVTMLFDEKDANTFYCLNKKSLATTKDNGKTWTEQKYDIEAGKWVYPSRSPKPLAIDITPANLKVYIPGEAPKDITPKKPSELNAAVTSQKNPATIAATCCHNVLFTHDGGKKWERIRLPDICPLVWIKFDPMDENRLFIVSKETGVYLLNLETAQLGKIGKEEYFYDLRCIEVSANGGKLWLSSADGQLWTYRSKQPIKETKPVRLLCTANSPRGGECDAVAVHPKDPNIVLVGGKGMAITRDGGKYWTYIIGSWGHVHEVESISICRSKPEVIYTIMCRKLEVSTNTGNNWYSVTGQIYENGTVKADPFDSKTAFVMDWRGKGNGPLKGRIHITNDMGKTINDKKIPDEYSVQTAFFDEKKEGLAFCVLIKDKEQEIAITQDHGRNWTFIPAPQKWETSHVSAISIDPKQEGILYLENTNWRGGTKSYWYKYQDSEGWELYYSADSGIPMNEEIQAKINALFVSQIPLPKSRKGATENNFCISQSNPLIAYFGAPFLQRTMDGGKTWEDVRKNTTLIPTHGIFPDPTDSNTVYCTTEMGLFKSIDGGDSFQTVAIEGIHAPRRIYFHPTVPGKFYISDWKALWTTDGIPLHTQEQDGIRGMVFDPDNPQKFHCIRDKSIYTTTDSGETWDVVELPKKLEWQIATSFKGKPLMVVATSDTQLDIYFREESPKAIDLSEYKETDKNFKIRYPIICPVDSSRIAFISMNGLYISSDMGDTWDQRLFTQRLFPSYVDRIMFHPKDKDTIIFFSSKGDISKYSIPDGKITPVAEGLEESYPSYFAMGADGKTYWLSNFDGKIWYYIEK